MPNRCGAAGCGSTPDIRNGIVLHAIPFYGDERPVAKKRRKQWVDFVKQKRAKWEATATSRLCSKHFKAEDFMRRFNYLEGQGEAVIPRLTRDEIGVVPVPSIHAVGKSVSQQSTSSTRRAHRQLVRSALNDSTTASITLVANQDELSQHSSPQEQPDDMAMDIHKAQNSQETETDLRRRMQAAEVLASFFSGMDSPL